VEAGRVVEAHGDLRPEHICLEPEPVVIDCLEFNRSLRILDVASELMFLALECERLGARQIGEWIVGKCNEETGDRPPETLLEFYKSYHACIRAQIAVWHLKDDNISNPAVWTEKAKRYLQLARPLDVAA
jgi:aminoglycoside phosphotransferase family enzyme